MNEKEKMDKWNEIKGTKFSRRGVIERVTNVPTGNGIFKLMESMWGSFKLVRFKSGGVFAMREKKPRAVC